MANNRSASRRPNMVVILVDDMGFSDIGCFGSEIATPNLDAMASGGVTFTQMYNCARCCPTRASLLTGLYPHQAGVGHMVGNDGVPEYQGYLRDDCVTIAEALKQAGYRAFYSGKWHCGGSYNILTPEAWAPGTEGYPYPLSRGFDRFYGTVAGCGNYFHPHTLMDQDRFIEPGREGYYYTDAISEQACRMIDEAADAARNSSQPEPFFLHMCYTAPHWPLHALEEDIARYEGSYRGGWDAVRTARHERLTASGLLEAKWPISPRDEQAPDWRSLDAARRDWEDQRMAVYAAQIDRMDQGIGRILATLRDRGLEDDTLVMFLSDNGGCAEFLNEDGDGRSWPTIYRHTARPGETCTVGNIPGLRPGPPTTYMSYDLPWSNASNTPFRLYKHWVHEGGVATPLVVRWPAGAAAGTRCDAPAHVIDIMATCLDAGGAAYPDARAGRAVTPLEGESFMPAVRGERWRRERPIFFEHEGNRAVRDGEWKLVSRHPGGWELYNMREDRTELADLAAKDTERTRRLAGMYDEWADARNVLPWEQVQDLKRRSQ
jgi:arylsulfatase